MLANLPGAKILAGGQSLMPMLNFHFVQPDHLVYLRRIEDLQRLEDSGNAVTIGAMMRQRDLKESALIAQAFPLMRSALDHVGHI